MTVQDNRRIFLKRGAAAAATGIFGGAAVAAGERPAYASNARQHDEDDSNVAVPKPQSGDSKPSVPDDFEEYSRYRPSYGGPPESDTYLGKLVPGLRGADRPPVPVEGPDLDKLPWKMVDGVKEFHIHCEAVSRELLPGNWMNLIAWRESEVLVTGYLLHNGLEVPPQPMPAGHINSVPKPR